MQKMLLLLGLFSAHISLAQNTFNAVVKDERTREVLPGVTVYIEALKIGATSNEKGEIGVSGLPDGNFEVKFSYVGYQDKKQVFRFPPPPPEQIFEIDLEPKDNDLDEVVVSTTRSSRSIQDIATRIEPLTAEELAEKTTMRPGDIKMLLNESTGIATQQTSGVSGTANIRIQGLDGRYTQFLRDGMPLYQGFSGGLSVMQIAPLDLKQVEFIKGSASTLFGGGAIAGLVNLISRTPEERREIGFLLNGTSAKGFDGSGFYSQKWKKVGTVIFSSYNFNAPYDPANIGLTAIPQTNRLTFNPKLFLYLNEKTTGWISLNSVYEDRFGGDIKVIEGKADNLHQYFERNKTLRLSEQISFTHRINQAGSLNFKNTVGFFDRKILLPASNFKGQQVASFSELNYVHTELKSEWITGLNLWTDHFTSPDSSGLGYNLTTFGAFIQNTFKATNWFSLETGLRVDANSPRTNDRLKGVFILPRLNALFKINEHWTSRVGGGLGYKMPTPFSEEAEERGFQGIQPINFAITQAEQSIGGNADVNYRTQVGEIFISLDQLFFYTHLDKPLILQGDRFQNAKGYVDTKGAETNVKIRWEHLTGFIGYTYTDATRHFDGTSAWQPLTSRHRLNGVLTWEKSGKYRAGVEGLYVSDQRLSDGTVGRGYVMFGALLERMWEHFTLFINVENGSDRRQTRWDTIYTGSITSPVFRDIYAPTDGIVVNIGCKIKL